MFSLNIFKLKLNSGAVFAAEQQLAKGSIWHQSCFNCAECHRPLDSTLANDGPDREIHCR